MNAHSQANTHHPAQQARLGLAARRHPGLFVRLAITGGLAVLAAFGLRIEPGWQWPYAAAVVVLGWVLFHFQREQQRAEALLRNVLPGEILDALKSGTSMIAQHHAAASVLMADVAGFAPLTTHLGPEASMAFMGQVYEHFDALVEKHGLTKIRTVGDNYLVAAGIPQARADHAPALAALALDMLAYAASVRTPLGQPLQLRLGLNSGPLVAGVIGQLRYQYDIWGDTVNIASRMESQGEPGKIQVAPGAYALLTEQFDLEPRGVMAVKGLGEMETWYLNGRKPAARRHAPSAPASQGAADSHALVPAYAV